MAMFKNKMRSAHGVFSSKKSSDAARKSNITINSAKMGSSTELAPAYVDSVMAPDTDANPNVNGSGGAFNEPLVLDFATMQDASNSITRSAPLSPVTRPVDPERHESWLSDDDTSAPAPQIDFTRKDIHIPFRTRYYFNYPPDNWFSLLILQQFRHSSGHPKAYIVAKTTER
jgi:hypothetical protein